VNIFTTSGAFPHENQKDYSHAKYNSGIVIPREIYSPFPRLMRADRVKMVQILHRWNDLLQLLAEPDNS
jgi:hypothetical protein